MSTLFLIRAFAFLILPLLLAGIVIAVDKSVNTRERRYELFLIYTFAFSAAGGIAVSQPLLGLLLGLVVGVAVGQVMRRRTLDARLEAAETASGS